MILVKFLGFQIRYALVLVLYASQCAGIWLVVDHFFDLRAASVVNRMILPGNSYHTHMVLARVERIFVCFVDLWSHQF